jgi:opacity protein-like surface antigen
MRSILIGTVTVLALASAAHARVAGGTVATAVDAFGQGDVHYAKKDKYKYKWKGGDCKYEFKADHKGVKEKYKCK